MTYENWWEGLKAGRSFVTNGPLLRVQANGKLPGHIFTANERQSLDVELKATLTSRDKIRHFEIIKNGQVERTIPFEEWSKNGGIGTLKFTSSGWFLVRVIADNKKTLRFASTAPYYVEIGETKRRISKTSARFFLEWVKERSQRVKLDDSAQREEVLLHHRAAEKFWEEMVAKANAE